MGLTLRVSSHRLSPVVPNRAHIGMYQVVLVRQ
jgi:hypothetical protein